jgi:hypothetical protein
MLCVAAPNPLLSNSMKRFIFALSAFVTVSVSLLAAEQPFTVAVLDFEAKEEALRDAGPKISSLLQAALSTNEHIITVERAELEKILGEHELGLSGTVAPETAAKIGKLTGAKVLITGRVFKLDKDINAVAKIMSVETSRVFGEMAKAQTLSELATSIAEKVTRTLSARQADLAPTFASRDEQLEKLVASEKKERTNAVSVVIPETHYGARASDPAAQTELRNILTRVGFTVVDDKSDRKPDIEITGEAFSALGLRKGNLIACKSRIELQARRRSDGAILWTDRQTSVAADITEQTAAKTALENAARELASRLIAKL